MTEPRFDPSLLDPDEREYALRHLPLELHDRGQADSIRVLARSPAFLEAQAGTEGADPLITLRLALQSAIDRDRAPDMAAFAVSHARWHAATRDGSPLAAHRRRQFQRALQIADLSAPDRRALWYLLLAWESVDDDELDRARSVLGHLRRNPMPLLDRAFTEAAAADLLARVAHADEHGFAEIQQALLRDEGRAQLCQHILDQGRPELALRVACDIEGRRSRTEALTLVAARAQPATASKALDLAARAVADIPDERERAEGLARVAGAEREADRFPESVAHFMAAVEAAAVIAEGGERGRALSTIMRIQAETGDVEGALRTASAIVDSADEIEREEALARSAVLQARAGHLDAAAAALEQVPARLRDPVLVEIARRLAADGLLVGARAMVRRIDDGPARARGLIAVARATPAPHADPFLASAVEVAQAVDGHSDQVRLLAEVVLAKLDSGDSVGASATYELIASIAGAGDDRPALCAVGSEFAAAGCHDLAARAFATARATLYDERDRDELANGLWEIGMAQARSGSDGRSTLAASLRTAPVWEGGWWRPWTLAGIANVQVMAGDRVGARRTLDSAKRAAAALDAEDGWTSLATSAIAEALPAAGDHDAAIGLAFDSAHREARDRAMPAILARLVEAGRMDAAREMAARAVPLPADRMADPAAIAAMAVAMARAGDHEGALEVAGRDFTRRAEGQVRAVIAGAQAEAGDFAAAWATADEVAGWSHRWPAFLCIAVVATRRDAAADARACFESATDAARRIADGADAVAALTEISTARVAAGDLAGAQETLARTSRPLRTIEVDWKRAQAEARVAIAQVGAGDLAAAGETAAGIEQPWFRGEAILAVALRRIATEGSLAVEAMLPFIEPPHWRALALAAAAARLGLEGRTDEAAAYLGAVQAEMERVPEGEPRARLQEALAGMDIMLSTGERAADVAKRLAADRGQRIVRVASALAEAGDCAGFKRLLPTAAELPDAAHQSAVLVARLYPSQAAAVAAEFERSWEGGA